MNCHSEPVHHPLPGGSFQTRIYYRRHNVENSIVGNTPYCNWPITYTQLPSWRVSSDLTFEGTALQDTSCPPGLVETVCTGHIASNVTHWWRSTVSCTTLTCNAGLCSEYRIDLRVLLDCMTASFYSPFASGGFCYHCLIFEDRCGWSVRSFAPVWTGPCCAVLYPQK